MSKKIFILPLLGASLSFATWGYFPLQESDSGLEVRGNVNIGLGDNDLSFLSVDARYVLGTTLELALLNVGPQFSDPAGLLSPVVSARYQLGSKSLAFAEFALPFGPNAKKYVESNNDDGEGNDGQKKLKQYIHIGANSFIQLGYQQAFTLTSHFAWSSEIGFKMYLNEKIDEDGEDGEDEETTLNPGSRIHVATEADFNNNPKFIWFVGANAEMTLGESKIKSGEYSIGLEDGADLGVKVFGGASYELSTGMYIQEEVSMMLIHSGDTYADNGLAFKTSFKYSF